MPKLLFSKDEFDKRIRTALKGVEVSEVALAHLWFYVYPSKNPEENKKDFKKEMAEIEAELKKVYNITCDLLRSLEELDEISQVLLCHSAEDAKFCESIECILEYLRSVCIDAMRHARKLKKGRPRETGQMESLAIMAALWFRRYNFGKVSSAPNSRFAKVVKICFDARGYHYENNGVPTGSFIRILRSTKEFADLLSCGEVIEIPQKPA